MKARQLSIGYIIVIVMLVLHLLPVWGFKYFPTQDGLSHIYNAYVVKEYHKHENYRLREVYELNATIFPNWTSHALLVVLLYVFPPLVCEKIVLTPLYWSSAALPLLFPQRHCKEERRLWTAWVSFRL